jgi:hypothetical protein
MISNLTPQLDILAALRWDGAANGIAVAVEADNLLAV